MPVFTIEKYVIAKEVLVKWKTAWQFVWQRPVTDDTDVPICPYHHAPCIIDESIKKIDIWQHDE